jgi:hypothetical protein
MKIEITCNNQEIIITDTISGRFLSRSTVHLVSLIDVQFNCMQKSKTEIGDKIGDKPKLAKLSSSYNVVTRVINIPIFTALKSIELKISTTQFISTTSKFESS